MRATSFLESFELPGSVTWTVHTIDRGHGVARKTPLAPLYWLARFRSMKL